MLDLIRCLIGLFGDIDKEDGFDITLSDLEWQSLSGIANRVGKFDSTTLNVGRLFSLVTAATEEDQHFWEHAQLTVQPELPGKACVIDLTPVKGVFYSVCHHIRRARKRPGLN